MTIRSEKPVQELLTSRTNLLPNLYEKVAKLKHLNKLLHMQLESSLSPHCCVANFKDNCLIIEVESSAWVTRLRYGLPELLKGLRIFPEFKQLKTIEWYIRKVMTAMPERVVVHRPPLSTENVTLLRDTADCVSNDRLKRALQKLAK